MSKHADVDGRFTHPPDVRFETLCHDTGPLQVLLCDHGQHLDDGAGVERAIGQLWIIVMPEGIVVVLQLLLMEVVFAGRRDADGHQT